jgi:hypothetical protein
MAQDDGPATDLPDAPARGIAARIWSLAMAALAAFAVLVWANDTVTLQGERTIYTVSCEGGAWHGEHCTGKLAAAARYRFRALKPHAEVLFWTVGASAPSGKFDACTIVDGRNWICKPCADASRTITLQMAHGYAVPNPNGPTKPFHAVQKWRWWLIRWGIAMGSDAES